MQKTKENKLVKSERCLTVCSSKEDSSVKKLMSEIFEHWNSKNIIVHRNHPRKLSLILKRITEDFSKEEILQSIDNYATVYHDKNYYFKYKWNLETFLIKSNALPDFMLDGSKWLSYLQETEPEKEIEPLPEMRSEEEFFLISDSFQFIKDNYSTLIKTLRNMPYDEYLQTEHWLHFKSEARKYFQNSCQVCGISGDLAKLDIHHKTYENRGRETFLDVIMLCDKCHGTFHNN